MSGATYWKRRLLALLVLVTLVAAVWSLVVLSAGLFGSRSAGATTGLAGVSPVGQSQTWTVRPGDTLWRIARSVKPTGDIRVVLNPLMKQYSGQPLQIGDTLQIPAYKP